MSSRPVCRRSLNLGNDGKDDARLHRQLSREYHGEGDESSGASLEPGYGGGRIPPELREWVEKQYPKEKILKALDEVIDEECLELEEFLDLKE